MIFCRVKSSNLLAVGIVLAVATAITTTAAAVDGSTAPSTRPAAATISQADQVLEDQSLRVSESDVKPAELRTATPAAGTSNTADLLRIVVALGIVIGIILVLRAGVRKMSSLPGVGKNKLVTVLSRSMISPRQQILVLQVGKRLLVVGDSGGSMSQLCELTDPDEIAALVGQTRQSADVLSDSRKVSFGSIFRRANEPFDENEALAEEKPEQSVEVPTVEEVGGLLDKIKLLQQQYKLKS